MAGSLYIHIPFCPSKCSYCDFLSIDYDEGMARRYVEALKKEVRLLGGNSFQSVYVGGGTPTVLSAGLLEEVFGVVFEHNAVSPGAEITVEANPETIDRAKSASLRALGINRISLGVQSFSDAELKSLGRRHTARQAVKAIESLGVENFSLDLMYGIPGQTLRSWEKTVRQALVLGPKHISAYELTPEPGTPFFESLAGGAAALPPENRVVRMFEGALEAFETEGFIHYEVSNYAMPGFECRHNMNYWLRGEYLGLGAGAHSFTGGRRIRNTGYVFKYIEMLSKGELPVEESVQVSAEDEIKEIIFLGLRMTRGINIRKIGFLKDAAREFIDGGFMQSDNEYLRLTKRGLMVSNSVITGIFDKLGLD